MRNYKTFWVGNLLGKYNLNFGYIGGILFKILEAPRVKEYTTQ